MTAVHPTAVIDVVGLTSTLLGDDTPHLNTLAGDGARAAHRGARTISVFQFLGADGRHPLEPLDCGCVCGRRAVDGAVAAARVPAASRLQPAAARAGRSEGSRGRSRDR